MTAHDEFVRRTATGLTCCLTPEGCDDCPYAGTERGSFDCQAALMADALNLLQSSALLGDLEESERESDTELYYRKALVKLTKERKLSQAMLAARLGMSQSGLSTWLRGKHPVPPQFYSRIDQLLEETP